MVFEVDEDKHDDLDLFLDGDLDVFTVKVDDWIVLYIKNIDGIVSASFIVA